MTDLDLDAIEARAKVASAGRLNWQGIDALRSLVESDVPALVAALREARTEVDRLTCRHSLSSDGDEGPVVNLPGMRVVRWHCNECDGKWYDDDALADLRDLIRSQTDSLNAAEAEVERLRTPHAADLDRVTLLRAGAVVADLDGWRRRYEALRDGVLNMPPITDAYIDFGRQYQQALRAVVARVEGDES